MAEAGPSSMNDGAAFGGPSTEQRLAKAADYKSKGNELYKNKDYKAAIGKYHRALMYVKDLDMATMRREMRQTLGLKRPDRGEGGASLSDSHMAAIPQHLLDRAAEFEVSCWNNLAACLLQLPDPDYSKVEYYCNQVLERSSSNEKALYRRGVARYQLHDYEGAHQSLIKAQEISPGDANVKKYLLLCDKAMMKQAKEERTRYKGMFDKMAAQGDH